MCFIAQIDLGLIDGYEGKPKWAYLFMTDDEEGMAETYDEYSGENCLLLQPGNICDVETIGNREGPSLYRKRDQSTVKSICEYTADLSQKDDPQLLPGNEAVRLNQTELDLYTDSVSGNKVGGTPFFIQGEEYPSNLKKHEWPDRTQANPYVDPLDQLKDAPYLGEERADWLLVLQLDSCNVPFDINFGDAGVGYAFVTADGSEGRFLWQCC